MDEEDWLRESFVTFARESDENSAYEYQLLQTNENRILSIELGWSRGGRNMDFGMPFLALFVFVFIIVLVFPYPERAFTVL